MIVHSDTVTVEVNDEKPPDSSGMADQDPLQMTPEDTHTDISDNSNGHEETEEQHQVDENDQNESVENVEEIDLESLEIFHLFNSFGVSEHIIIKFISMV